MSKSQRGCNPTRACNDEFFIFFVGKVFKRIQILLKSRAGIYYYGEFGGVARTDQSCYEVYDSLFLHGCRSFCLDVRKLLKSRAVNVKSADKWNQNRTNYKQKAGGSKRHLFAVPHCLPHSDGGSPFSSRELRLVYRAWLLSHLRGCEVAPQLFRPKRKCVRMSSRVLRKLQGDKELEILHNEEEEEDELNFTSAKSKKKQKVVVNPFDLVSKIPDAGSINCTSCMLRLCCDVYVYSVSVLVKCR